MRNACWSAIRLNALAQGAMVLSQRQNICRKHFACTRSQTQTLDNGLIQCSSIVRG